MSNLLALSANSFSFSGELTNSFILSLISFFLSLILFLISSAFLSIKEVGFSTLVSASESFFRFFNDDLSFILIVIKIL